MGAGGFFVALDQRRAAERTQEHATALAVRDAGAAAEMAAAERGDGRGGGRLAEVGEEHAAALAAKHAAVAAELAAAREDAERALVKAQEEAQRALAMAREEEAAEAARAAEEEGGDHLAAQAEVGVADVAETGAEHSSALAGVATRLAEARSKHARQIADLEARAERAAEE